MGARVDEAEGKDEGGWVLSTLLTQLACLAGRKQAQELTACGSSHGTPRLAVEACPQQDQVLVWGDGQV